ncbi:MAG: DUF2461 domain-containing protein [Alphaproteobacteria bacterium]
MAKKQGFTGFPREAVKFFRDLGKNNSKAWFEAHRDVYDEQIIAPARGFVIEMGDKLRRIAPTVQADPRTNKSIFRIYRDTRFSRDKSPYKMHLGIFFWEGSRPKMECSGFYFHLEPPNLMIGAGIYMFPKPLLEEYRNSVVHPVHGRALLDAVEPLIKKGYGFGGEHYKRVLRGYDAEHPNAEWLKHNGLYVGFETKIPPELHSAKLVDFCFKHYKAMAPLHQWLVAMSERA